MAAEATTKDEVPAAIGRECNAWEALFPEVGEDRMLEPAPMGARTLEDLVVHPAG